eukprot:8745208-Lingulodinium_polyedra.AAC.1
MAEGQGLLPNTQVAMRCKLRAGNVVTKSSVSADDACVHILEVVVFGFSDNNDKFGGFGRAIHNSKRFA